MIIGSWPIDKEEIYNMITRSQMIYGSRPIDGERSDEIVLMINYLGQL